MVPAESGEKFCTACRHNRTVPDLSVPENPAHWAKIEAAKHRLFYSLLRLHLPLKSRTEDPQDGLAFDFLAEATKEHGANVMTGHDNGLITLAVKEADDAERARVRNELGEPYRTLLGHFRHEIGHYYWNVLVRDTDRLDEFRSLFGDERQDYMAALQAHYANGPLPDWQQNFVSAYAASHPWEDFAETWAHFLHIIDTLETAGAFGIRVNASSGRPVDLAPFEEFDPHRAANIENVIGAWLPLTFALNSLNRSMGESDLYPFILSPAAIRKLGFVLDLTRPAGSGRARANRAAKTKVPVQSRA
jgi:hypothetical protein